MASPQTVILEGSRLPAARKLLKEGDASLQASLQVLTAEADKWLQQGPWSVMAKKKAPPSGDMHDYTSQAPYWWPSESADGSPYVERDGQKNPEVLEYTDRVYVEKVFLSSYTLALAWYYSGNEAYAKHAGSIIRTWFVAPETRMNPNLNHAQLIPFANTGRSIGIIDFSQWYTSVLDAAAILDGGSDSSGRAPGWTAEDMSGFRQWNADFLRWLTDGDFGKEEHARKNNHGSFATMLVAAVALFVGDKERVKTEALSIQDHLNVTIEADGSLPGELGRTRSWHYSTFNLLALTRLALVAQKVGVDLWSYKGAKGQSINKAIEYITPAATRKVQWVYPERQFKAFAAADIIRAAADAGHEISKQAVKDIETPPEGDVWPLRPAPEQLDPVKVDGTS